jgi:CTP:molybdopterin cytidylyltransferase MocA
MPKQLATYLGENLVRRAARIATEAGVEPVIVVLGAYASTIEPALAGLRVVTITNNDWQSGQSTSLRAGIGEASRQGCDGALVLLPDQPLIDTTSISRLIKQFDSTHRVVASSYSETFGVPAIFGSEYFEELGSLEGDYGAGKWIRSRPDIVTVVSMPEAEVDIDTTDDLVRITPGSTAE